VNVLASARRWFSPDPRSRREIEGDIVEELAFHIDMATEDLVASGLERDEARARACARFGDFERVRAACRREQLGGRIMLLRIQWIVIAVLASALIVLGFRSVAAERMALAQQERAMAQAAELAEQLRAAQAASTAAADPFDGVSSRRVVDQRAATDLSLPPTPVVAANADPQAWLARFNKDPDDWRSGLDLAYELVETLEPAKAFEVMKTIYPRLSLAVREQVFKPFVLDGGHPFALQMLQLGSADTAPSVRERAYGYLKDYAFVDFSEDPSRGEAWFAKYGALPLDRAIVESATAMVERLRGGYGDALAHDMRVLSDANFAAAKKAGVDVDATLRNAGLLALVRQWTASGDDTQIVFGLRAAAWMNLSETELRGQLGAMERNAAANTPAVWDEYCRLVGRPGNAWAVTPLVDHLHAQISAGERGEALFHHAMALAKIGDASAIPHLIGLLRADDSTDQRYALGYFGLRELTGVSYDESHSAQWWVDWWSANSSRFPSAGGTPIPDYGH
jgi:hypothetical protein